MVVNKMKVMVETSAHHVHVTKETLEALFGKGATLTNKKDLSQPGQFACVEKVTVVGPKSEMKMSILGPERSADQVEISLTDARKLGIAAPVKESGDIAGTPGCKLVGPAGEVEIDDNAILSATVLCHQFCRIGGYVMIQGGCRFSLDIPPYVIAGKEPTRYCGINIIGLRRRGYSNEQIDMIHDTYRIIYANGILKDGIQEARTKYPGVKEVEYICKFIENSKRGVIR